MSSIYRTVQQDIVDARAALRASTESMRAYCAYMDSNGDWSDATDLELRCVILRWIDDMRGAL